MGHPDVDPHPPNITNLRNKFASKLTPFSGLILTIALVIIFLLRFYFFERIIPKIHGVNYTRLDDRTRRTFVNHYVAGTIKLVLLATMAYPFISVCFGHNTLKTFFPGSKHVKLGDIMVVGSQLFIAMYVFELFYRAKISPVSAAHHIGAILIAQTAVSLWLEYVHEVDATIEFVLCFVWGAFDVLAEFWPHVAIILYRTRPNEHAFLSRVFLLACGTELLGTLLETIIVMWLFGSLWNRWTLSFKIVTPILHIIFSVAQIWGAIIFYRMWKRQESLLRKKAGEGTDLEGQQSMTIDSTAQSVTEGMVITGEGNPTRQDQR